MGLLCHVISKSVCRIGIHISSSQDPTRKTKVHPWRSMRLSQIAARPANIPCTISVSLNRVGKMQTKALAWLMMQREELTCGKSPLNLRCTSAQKTNTEDGILSSESPGISISVEYVKVMNDV